MCAYGWQYLHLVSAGLSASLVIHQTDVFGERRIPYVSLSYRVGALQGHAHSQLSAPGGALQPSDDFATHGRGVVVISDTACAIDVSAGNIGLEGILTRPRPVVPPKTALVTAREGGRGSCWQLLFWDALFRGILRVDGRRHDCSAAFYMDRQWGTFRRKSRSGIGFGGT